jgi:2-amino-4-hydroxy-6-hydroxymethyldihydropteridine diphosphokinase
VRWFLGLGANLGDREAALRFAIEALERAGDVRVLRSSSVYETDPVGGPEQPPYLNAVIEVETELAPHALLDRALGIEAERGRARAERWGPRVLDIDLLEGTADDGSPIRIDDARLTVPHPRMRERAFVLVPLAELTGEHAAPDPGVRRAEPPLPLGR